MCTVNDFANGIAIGVFVMVCVVILCYFSAVLGWWMHARSRD